MSENLIGLGWNKIVIDQKISNICTALVDGGPEIHDTFIVENSICFLLTDWNYRTNCAVLCGKNAIESCRAIHPRQKFIGPLLAKTDNLAGSRFELSIVFSDVN